MLEKTLSVPDSILEQLHCSSCNGYLSCGPVRVLPDGSCICGRCSPLTSEAPVYRVLALEAILSRILFPCRFNQRGCAEFLSFGHAVEHETKCTYRSFLCPLVQSFGCTWNGSSSEIPAHFSKKHSELVMENIQFKIGLDEDVGGILMVIKENVGFIVKYQYDSVKGNMNYEIGYCRNKNLPDAAYKVQLFNDSDSDCNVGLKAIQCRPYNETFYNLQNPAVLNLNNFLQNLDNPNRIAIKFFVIQNGPNDLIAGVDYSLLKKLRCENCHNYLIPPLFESEGRAICCDCSKLHPDCVSLNNKKIQKLVADAKFPCRWRDCKFIGKSDIYKVHELNCPFRHYDCFFPSCRVSFKISSAIDHLQSHRAQFFPSKIVYKMDFSQTYTIKHVFTIKDNTILLIQHSVVDIDPEKPYTHRVALFSSDPCEFSGNIDFEHQHCKLKSKPFVIVSKHNTDIALNELPFCFKSNDELAVSVNV